MEHGYGTVLIRSKLSARLTSQSPNPQYSRADRHSSKIATSAESWGSLAPSAPTNSGPRLKAQPLFQQG